MFSLLPNILILSGIVFVLFSVAPIVTSEIWFAWKEFRSQEYVLAPSSLGGNTGASIFAKLLTSKPVLLTPANREFSIVIERIGLSSPIVPDVSVTNENAYKQALKEGIAHAITSNYPSEEPSNVFLFSHASVNFWELGKYATAFNLLKKLDQKDRVHIYYKDQVFVYEVVNKEVMEGWNTYPLTRPTIEPTLTLMTCDPPGTTINRLVVVAKLISVE